ncbi:GNAT family N-acetyltransferase [Rhodococcus qingshengii]|uniref:GNAT family N-acetyltransferase n=1 Tax=Rhodococcus TaxID=1827 RepID=UPI0009C24E35|nr:MULTISPECIES: N-acetyltransferase [Rhodococcus]ARE35919.1 GNAT family acetyltransferase [Rhodococcus sp. BH4]ORC27991.1 GNAT family N-acetyltransferase [Rhodococcus qingshengii]QXC42017.1 N-acetyltransferase [Rhodococcus qingshengii]
MYIRRETSSDRDAIYSLLGAAFADQAPPGESPYEIELTRQLFASNDYLPKLSLVAVAGDEIVGFVIGTRGWVGPVEAVGLGPLAVTPDNQRSGVGSALMHAVIGASDALDVPLLALLGSTEYYPQFGFVTSTDAGIESPEAEWGKHFQIRTLTTHRPDQTGKFSYAAPFGVA